MGEVKSNTSKSMLRRGYAPDQPWEMEMSADQKTLSMSLILCGAIALNAILMAATGGATAAQPGTSTLTVNVQSVDPESFTRKNVHVPCGSSFALETTKYVAKAQITKVLNTDHGLSPGAVIDIRYSVTVRQPPLPAFPVSPMLSPGETVTLTVFGEGGSFSLSPPRTPLVTGLSTVNAVFTPAIQYPIQVGCRP
jgi:hypothetical protein